MRLATGLLGLCETPDGTPAPSRMKVFLPMLLAALLGVDRAHSLVCFSCTNQNSNFYCLKPTVCSDSDNYCVTMSAAAGIGNIVDLGHSLNKGCSPICPGPPSVNLGVASVGVHCCQSFLCNISAADGGLRASATMLGLGLLLSLLSALLRLGP
ncbi:lymphocyte antigen 6E isoform X1 [Equus asinus]|nr:lymphocyte antigen 6E isoform X1 [Equus caballus]XP_046498617.1 lymphocyte antigen 6E isoform X1 [Equus quagga]